MISVVMPTHDRPDLLLERAIPSVMVQTVRNWELIVVGDGTDPLTCDRMAELVERDERVSFVNLPRASYPDDVRLAWGISGAVATNHGMDLARGEWIWKLDDDDELEVNAFALLLEAQERTGADVVYGISRWWNERGYMNWDQGSFPPGPGVIADGASIRRAELPYRYALDCWDRNFASDSDLWTRMIAGGVRFHFEPAPVHRYWHWRPGFGA